MKKDFLISLALLVLVVSTSAWASCPADTNDRGNCDTMYIEPWHLDVHLLNQGGTPPFFVRVPIFITADVNDMYDSIVSFVIPLCFTRSNPTKYCSLSAYYNTISFTSTLSRSIWRDLDGIQNWMLDLYQLEDPIWPDAEEDWDTRICNVSPLWYKWSPTDSTFHTDHFWLSLIAGGDDRGFGSGSRILLATMTFKLEDSMQVCIDTCLWPPSSRLSMVVQPATGGLAIKKKPRPGGTDPNSFRVCFDAVMSDVKEIHGSDEARPSQFSISQNYPNPFNPITNFQFTLPKTALVKVEIFNIVGQKVRTLVEQEMKPGVYLVDWDGKDDSGNPVSSGIYFYRVVAGEFSDMKKMVLLK